MTLNSLLPLISARRSGLTPVALAVLLSLAGPAAQAQDAPAVAQERAGLEQLRNTTLSLIQALVDQGLLSRDKAAAIIQQAQAPQATATAPAAAAPAQAAAKPGTVRVPYIPETLRAQIKEELKNEVLATAKEEGWADSRQIPEWSRRIAVEGDVRVRLEAASFDQDNAPASSYRAQVLSPAWSPDLTNTQHARTRMTLRARLGVVGKVSEDVSSGIRLSTGNAGSNPASASATLGDDANRLSVSLDRAWIRWEPRWNVHVDAGRIANPFFATDLVWPTDVNLDGVSMRYEQTLATGLGGFVTAGVFPMKEIALSTSADKWLLGLQAGADWAVGDYTQLRLGAAIYDFRHAEGSAETLPAPTGSAAGTTAYQASVYTNRQRGNTLINLNDPTNTGSAVWGLASKFRPVTLTAAMTFNQLSPYSLGLSAEWVRNTAFDLQDIRRRANDSGIDVAEKTTGYQLRAQFGSPKLAEKGDWQTFLAIRKFERDAWIDAYTDTTWNLGGTNYKGLSLGGNYTFDRNTHLGLRYTSTRNLDDGARSSIGGVVSTNLSNAPFKVDVLQVELNTRF
jgi:hypothetical protein